MSWTYTRILLFTVWSGIGVPSFRRARCLHQRVCTLMTEPARTYHTHTSGRNPKDKNSLMYVRFTFCFPVGVSGLCYVFTYTVVRTSSLRYCTAKFPKPLPSAGNWLIQASNAKVSWGHIRNCKNRYDCPSHASIWFTLYRSYKKDNVRFSVTLRHLRGTIVSVQKQEILYILCVCLSLSVCIISDPACKAHAPYFIVLSVLFDCTTFFYISYKQYDYRKKVTGHKICVLIFSTTLNTFSL